MVEVWNEVAHCDCVESGVAFLIHRCDSELILGVSSQVKMTFEVLEQRIQERWGNIWHALSQTEEREMRMEEIFLKAATYS